MSKFTKTLIVSALAVAMAGPAAAAVKEDGTFDGTKMTLKVNPNGCKNGKTDVPQSSLQLWNDTSYPESGSWEICGSVNIGDSECIEGWYIERKVGKDLTMAMDSGDLGGCFVVNESLECDGITGAIQGHLSSESCGAMTEDQGDSLTITKGQTKLSKNGARAKVDMKIEGEYTTDKNKVNKVKATIKSSKMDFVAD